jgi:predicted HAD superfamily phosphohydrolase YqeG
MLRQLLRPNWLRECTLAELPLQELLSQPIRALVLDVDIAVEEFVEARDRLVEAEVF